MDTDNLTRLINEKHGVLVQLHELGKQQARLIHGEDINELLMLLSAKQTWLNKLQAVEDQLVPYRDDDPESRIWSSSYARKKCAEVNRQCEALLAAILKTERSSEQVMQRRRDVAAARLEGSGNATAARRAYIQGPHSNRLQLDISSEVPPS